MSTKKPRSSSKATKADLEAKIAELEAKLNSVSSQLSEPAPQPKHEAKAAPKPARSEEAAPEYSTSSSVYTGNKYYATRQRLAYHPPDKQFRGKVAATVQVSRPAPAPEPEPERAPEPQPESKKSRRIEPPAPRIKYTGGNYYKTRQRLAYHPADKQFKEATAIEFDEPPTVAQVESSTSSESQSQSQSSSDKKSKAEQLAQYEKEYLERVQQQKSEAAKPAEKKSTPSPHGTMPSGWKPS